MLSESDKGYLAGMIDGEGTITITKHKQHNRKTYQLKTHIWICNTNKECLEYIQKILGFGVINKNYKKDHKTLFNFRVMAHDKILEVLNLIDDKLIVKKERSTLLREFIESRKSSLKVNLPYTEKEIMIQQKIKNLNFR